MAGIILSSALMHFNTFRNMLTAYDMCAMTQYYKDMRFYAFDVFGDPSINFKGDYKEDGVFSQYYSGYLACGDQLKKHEEYLNAHGLFRDQCHLIQGLFEHTLTPEFKKNYLAEKRHIGFAFVDCNIPSSYRTVFKYIFDMIGEDSYIYMDEYFQSPEVIRYYEQFVADLRTKRNMGSVYIRNAGGFGGLFRLYPLDTVHDHYDD